MREQYVIAILVLSCFGPYLMPLVRLEQLVLYGGVVALTPWLFLTGRKIFDNTRIARMCIIFVLFIIWSTISAILHGESIFEYGYLASLESYLQPVAVMIFGAALLRNAAGAHLISVLKVVISMMCVGALFNSMVALYHVLFGVPWFIDYFLPARSALSETNVWDRSVGMGRIIGTFASPFEAGIVYGSALIGATYLYYGGALRALVYVPVFLVICFGGMLTVSKAFFVGLVLAGFYHLRHGNVLSVRWAIASGFALAGFLVFFAGVSEVQWKGLERFDRYFKMGDGGSAVVLYTAGRYGSEDGTITSRVQSLLDQSPVIGYGMQYVDIFDSGFLQPLMFGGLVGLALYCGIFVELFRSSSRRVIDRRLASYMRILVIYALIASAGAPVLTLNKFAVMFWLQFSVLALLAVRRRKEGTEALEARELLRAKSYSRAERSALWRSGLARRADAAGLEVRRTSGSF